MAGACPAVGRSGKHELSYRPGHGNKAIAACLTGLLSPTNTNTPLLPATTQPDCASASESPPIQPRPTLPDVTTDSPLRHRHINHHADQVSSFPPKAATAASGPVYRYADALLEYELSLARRSSSTSKPTTRYATFHRCRLYTPPTTYIARSTNAKILQQPSKDGVADKQ